MIKKNCVKLITAKSYNASVSFSFKLFLFARNLRRKTHGVWRALKHGLWHGYNLQNILHAKSSAKPIFI